MGITLGERYELKKLITPLNDGLLYDARDHALMRDVFLYIVDHRTAERIQLLEKVRLVSWIGSDRFLHILNAGHNEEIHYVALAAQKGSPFIQNIHAHPFTGEEILREVYAIGKSIHDAESAELQGINVTAENMWFSEDRRLLLVDTWSQAEPEKKGVAGLILLIKQLAHFSLHDQNTLDQVQYSRAQLPFIFQMMPSNVRTKLANLLSSNHELHSLTSFLTDIEQILVELKNGHSVSSQPSAPPELESQVSTQTNGNQRQISALQRSEEKQLHVTQEQDAHEAEEPRGMDLGLKIGIFTMLVTGVIAIFMVWNFSRLNQDATEGHASPPAAQDDSVIDALIGDDEEETSPDADESDADEMTDIVGTVGDERIGAVDNEGTAGGARNENTNTNTPSPDRTNDNRGSEQPEREENVQIGDGDREPVNEGDEQINESDEIEQAESDESSLNDNADEVQLSDGNIVQVPDLIGMELEEAEAELLRRGLRYQYFIEASDEESGTVFRQEPEGFVDAERGTRVTFWVSR